MQQKRDYEIPKPKSMPRKAYEDMYREFSTAPQKIIEAWTEEAVLPELPNPKSDTTGVKRKRAIYASMILLSKGAQAQVVKEILIEQAGYSYGIASELLCQGAKMLLSERMVETLRTEYQQRIIDIMDRAKATDNMDTELRAIQLLARLTKVDQGEQIKFKGTVEFNT